MKILLSVVCLVFVATVKSTQTDYYWKEYSGVVPADALPGGRDVNGQDTYIGQAYVHGHGIFVVQIYPGVVQVEVPCYGVKKTDKIIKILCTHNRNRFEWVKTSASSYHVDTINKHPVVGGYDHVGNKGILNIGRINYQGILKIGEITAFKLGKAQLHFPHRNIEHKADHYDVLIYSQAPKTEKIEKLNLDPYYVY